MPRPGKWQRIADGVILAVASEFEGEDRKELEKRIRRAYPFGTRECWPYKVWLRQVRRYLDDGPDSIKNQYLPEGCRQLTIYDMEEVRSADN